MGALKLWDGSQWVTVPRVGGPPGPAGPAATDFSLYGEASGHLKGEYPYPEVRRENAGTLLGMQIDRAVDTGYVPIATGEYFTKDANTDLQIEYRTEVPCWWDVTGVIGSIWKTDAAYNYGYAQLVLSPPDADDITTLAIIAVQHSTVTSTKFRIVRRLYRLEAGYTYTCKNLFSASGGTWQFYQSPKTAFIIGKVFAS